MYIERRARPSTASAGDRRATGGRPTSDWRATRERPAGDPCPLLIAYHSHAEPPAVGARPRPEHKA